MVFVIKFHSGDDHNKLGEMVNSNTGHGDSGIYREDFEEAFML